MLQLFMAISPILIVMIGIVGLKKPATIVSAIALIYTIFVTMFYGNFKLENDVLFSETTKGIIEGAKMVFVIWSAFLILNMLINTGAMDKIKEIIANLTLDKRKQFIIIAFCFGGFLEGVAGAGTRQLLQLHSWWLWVSHLYLRLLAHLFLMELPHLFGQRG